MKDSIKSHQYDATGILVAESVFAMKSNLHTILVKNKIKCYKRNLAKPLIFLLGFLLLYPLNSNAQTDQGITMIDENTLLEYKILSLTGIKKGFFKKKEEVLLVLGQVENPNEKINMLIGKTEAIELTIAIEEMKTSRPLPSEVLKTLITEFGFTLSKVIIDDLKDDIFYAKLILSKASETKSIDCRPADALTQATRFGAGIFVSKTVIAKQKS